MLAEKSSAIKDTQLEGRFYGCKLHVLWSINQGFPLVTYNYKFCSLFH